jgi:hypothetical protein
VKRCCALVCGGRDFSDYEFLQDRLWYYAVIYGFTELIHGGARGADALAAQWAKETGITARAFPANWQQLGRAAGPMRNQEMIEIGKPDIVLAFLTGGNGTKDMIRRSQAANIPTVVFT